MAKFKEAHISADTPRMKIYASALQQFTKVSKCLRYLAKLYTYIYVQGYSKCVDSFIQNSLLVCVVCINWENDSLCYSFRKVAKERVLNIFIWMLRNIALRLVT